MCQDRDLLLGKSGPSLYYLDGAGCLTRSSSIGGRPVGAPAFLIGTRTPVVGFLSGASGRKHAANPDPRPVPISSGLGPRSRRANFGNASPTRVRRLRIRFWPAAARESLAAWRPLSLLSSWPSTRLASSIESILPIAFAGTPGGQSGQGAVRTHPHRLPDRSVGDPTSASCFRSTMPAGTDPRTWQCPTPARPQPPCSTEHLWAFVDEPLANRCCATIESLDHAVGERCLVAQPARPDEAFPAARSVKPTS
jgi:hypothetical protein